ncbi:hypothetical protein ScPMuIL_005883 [Solemya velum]
MITALSLRVFLKWTISDSPECSLPSGKKVNLYCRGNACGARSMSVSQAYILGGSESVDGQWPWVVGIKSGDVVVCGGSLISDRWLSRQATAFNRIASTPGGQRMGGVTYDQFYQGFTVKVTEIIQPPSLRFYIQRDFALLRLQRQLIFTDHVRPLCLPRLTEKTESMSLCYIAGWVWLK